MESDEYEYQEKHGCGRGKAISYKKTMELNYFIKDSDWTEDAYSKYDPETNKYYTICTLTKMELPEKRRNICKRRKSSVKKYKKPEKKRLVEISNTLNLVQTKA